MPRNARDYFRGFQDHFGAAAYIGLALALQIGGRLSAAERPPLDSITQRVARAQQFTSANLLSKIANVGVSFRWIGTSDRFWFRKAGNDGRATFIVVDAASGRQELLFNDGAMRAALARAGASGTAPISVVDVVGDGRLVRIGVPKADAKCRWPEAPGRCTLPTDSFMCDLPVTTCHSIAEPDPRLILSPNRKQAAFVRNYNLWARDLTNGAERQLTTDVVAHFAYGETHIQLDDGRISRRRAGEPESLTGILWSPDGSHILTIRHDLRDVPDREIATEYLPPEGGRPIVHTGRVAIASDPEYPKATVEVIDVAKATRQVSNADPLAFGDYTALYYSSGLVWWSNDNTAAFIVGFRRGARDQRLIRIDVATGRATDTITETARTTIIANRNALTGPNVRPLASGNEAVWFSERDGWGHLYLYDLTTGQVKRQITKGPWRVVDLVRLDEPTRTVYFTAVGREPGQDPYFRHLYSVGLDGGEPKLLTPENADHNFGEDVVFSGGSRMGGSVSPSGRYFIDCYSTPSQPDKIVVRKTDGVTVANVLEADISSLLATGWRPPERFLVKAADGKTELYGVMYKPIAFDPAKKYPVIEITYPAPGFKFVPTAFWENFTLGTTLNEQALAELGTVVVALDGRGGGLRSRAFRETFYGSDDPTGVVDHVAAIRNLAVGRPYLDLDRIGVTGHSFGGYASLRAMLLYPDVFKVAVSGEGPADLSNSGLDLATERLFGVPTDPQTKSYYRRISNNTLVSRLQGKLLLIYGGADEDVPLQNAFQMFAALQSANKLYDTLIMPDSPHYGGREPYGVMRTLRYFAENLGDPK